MMIPSAKLQFLYIHRVHKAKKYVAEETSNPRYETRYEYKMINSAIVVASKRPLEYVCTRTLPFSTVEQRFPFTAMGEQ